MRLKHVLGLIGAGFLSFALAGSAQAVMPTLALGGGVTNPPPNLASTSGPPQIAIPDTATIIGTAGLQPVLQATLTAQGFSNANNWNLVGNAVDISTATFTLTTYNLNLNGAGNAFGEPINFNLGANPPQPALVGGQVATLHWLQLINESQPFQTAEGMMPFGFPIAGQPGFWQLDNGDMPGAAANGATVGGANGPYYDSNGGPTGATQVVPNFGDNPHFYSGPGTYLHFDAIPTWDIYTPANGMTPASDSIDIANYGLAWGFAIVPEPSSISVLILAGSALCLRRKRAMAC